jgi:hypothetical protein
MSEPATTLTEDEVALKTQAILQRQLERLEELAEMGMRLARAVEAEVTAGEIAPAKAIVAVQRAGRAVRQCGLLQIKVLNDLARAAANDRIFGARRREAEAEQAAALADPAYGHKARVERIVGRIAAEEHRDDEDAVERLAAECAERLEDDDVYGDVMDRPVGELVALICRDLDLDPDWTRLAQEAWAQDEHGLPGSPFAHLAPKRPPPFAAANGEGGPPGERPPVEGEGHSHTPILSSA